MNHLYCIRLTALKPGTNERQKVIVNQVVANHPEEARDAAIRRLCEHDARMYDADIRYVSARRTDDAFWAKGE